MSKKINLFSKCLALTIYWSYNFQIFSKNFYLFKKYFSIIILLQKLINNKKLFYLNLFLLLKTKIFISKNNFNIHFILFYLKKKWNSFFQFFFSIRLLQDKYFLSLKSKIFVVKNFFFSNFFFSNLIFYLLLEKKFNPKKIFNFFLNLFKNNFNFFLVQDSKNGFLKKKLIGFKVQLKGRFEVTKNSMSKKNLIKLGKVNSTNLNNHIIFYEHIFFSKLGVSNLKIWLFYKNVLIKKV